MAQMAREVRCRRKQTSRPKVRRRARSKVRFCENTWRQSWSRLPPSKIFLELSGNAGVESKARNWIESIARFGERADDSLRRERSALRAKVDGLVIASKISPHPEVLTQTNLVIQSRPDSDSMDLRPIGASDGLTSLCGSSRRAFC